MRNFVLVVLLTGLFAGCAPEIGSEEWCQALKDKNKADWAGREMKDFTKHCLFD